MNVKELIGYLQKCDERAEVLVQTDRDSAKTVKAVRIHFNPLTIGGDDVDNDFVDMLREKGERGEILEPYQKVILEANWGLYGRYNFEESLKLLDKIKLELDTVKILKDISQRDLTNSERVFLDNMIGELELNDVIFNDRGI